MPFLEDWLQQAERDLVSAHLLREPRVIESVRGPFVTIAGREVLNFASNDYLGLSQDPKLADAARRIEGGWGTGSSRLVAGTTTLHEALERRIAEFLGAPAALLFASGSAANAGLIGAIIDEKTLVLSDALNHASVIDACRLSRAKTLVYPHRDVDAAERLLKDNPAGRRFIFTDAVFSMDGDLAPLADLAAVADRHGADLLVDDAHGFGLLGDRGRGTPELLSTRVAARTANLAKSAGSIGGFVAGSAALKRILTTRARSFIFTTAHPPAVVAAGIAAIDALAQSNDRRARVLQLADRLSKGARTPIIPRVIGSAEAAVAASRRLLELGFFVPAIRPPAVARNEARLRITVTALHEPGHVDSLLDALKKI